ncbi:sensor histidine kinase [Maribellus mangrovi]|uniref:sensor histidine kinase n=1 Tax=Maribellus mangrovi TaxID=3133146 RepID=UPI0030EB539B
MKKSVIILSHIGFWLIIWILFVGIFYQMYSLANAFMGSGSLSFWDTYEFPTLAVMVLTIPFYGFFFFTKLILKNIKLLIYPLILIILLYPLNLFILRDSGKGIYISALINVIIILLFGLLGGLAYFFTDWFKKNKLKTELERKNHESTLALLRSQINPHFLFNTLHNINTLIHDDQDKATESLVMLADIMRYMLKEAKFDLVELQKEIEHLESYLALEKLRLKNEKFLNYSFRGDCKGIKVAPMLMIPFVENAFKHSVDSNIENGIVIELAIENGTLKFCCINQFYNLESDKDKGHGIGLETVRKRLDLIYPNKHNLTVDSRNQIFAVNLELELNEN